MKVYYCDTFVLPLPKGHRFPMIKYELLRLSLMEDLELHRGVRLRLPPAASDSELLSTHCSHYLEALKTDQLDPKIEP